MENSSKKMVLGIIVSALILISGITFVGYQSYNDNSNDKENNENIDKNDKPNEDESNENPDNNDTPNDEIASEIKGQLKVLVYQINIRKEVNTTSEDIGDVYFNEIYDVYDIVGSANYTWYKIKKDNVFGWVANKKDEYWIKYYKATNKTIYFYIENGELIVKTNYDENCIGQYKCNYECNDYFYSTYSPLFDLNYHTIRIRDGAHLFLYNYQTKEKILDLNTYDSIYSWQGYMVAEKNKKVQIITFEGKKSKFHEDIADFFTISTTNTIPGPPLQNISAEKQIVAYKKGNKYGLLSLKTLTEITDATYDYISIFDNNIVAKVEDLEYVMNENGNIISKGYKNIMWSNDKIIIISENGFLDIIDFNGNSKIKEKINTYGEDHDRKNYYEIMRPIWFDTSDNKKITIYINSYINSDAHAVYIYDLEKETLTKED